MPATLRPWSVHVEIGKAALRKGLIQFEELCQVMLDLGRAEPDAAESEPDLEAIWVASGLLDTEAFEALREECLPSVSDEDDQHETIARDHTMVYDRGPKTLDQPEGAPPVESGAMAALSIDMPTIVRFESGPSSSQPSIDGAELSSPFELGDFISERYLLQEEVGRGGSGRVFKALDLAIGRVVAMKVMRAGGKAADAAVERFVREARSTGRLEHPNIMPIYDVGVLTTGEVYYTMKFVRKHSLREVFRALHEQDETLRKEYNLTRLVQIFLNVCQAISYAHAQGIIHRDLKPDNILLGDYGEVLVTDWGLARLLEEPAEVFGDQQQTLGTPAYMPPEQAMGRLNEVAERADIYSLGALLYEVLTLKPPFEGPSAMAILDQVAEGLITPPSQRAPGRHIPRELEAICLNAMAPNPEDRFETAKALHDAIVRFNEGRQAKAAERKAFLGRANVREYFAALDESRVLSEERRLLQEEIAPWEGVAIKRQLWRIEDTIRRANSRMAQSYSDAVRAFTQALALDADLDSARTGLAALYWSRFEEAERKRDIVEQVHYDALLHQVDGTGEYIALLEGDGALELESEPPGAHITLRRFLERDRVLQPMDARRLGVTPHVHEPLPMGSYLVELHHDDEAYAPVRYPVHIERSQRWSGRVRIPRRDAIPEGFVFIPGGPGVVGGDSQAPNADVASVRDIDDVLIARYPVTFGEYIEFLDDIHTRDPEEAARRAPQTREGDGQMVELREGRYHPRDILIEGAARTRYPAGAGFELQLPVICVSVFDALAYIAWRSERDGVRYRLPHVDEWERAARGVDGRAFPWGDAFDATFCKMRLSRPELPQPEPVGTFENDTSVYGVCDMAGTVQEWCRDEAWYAAYDTDPDSPLPDGSLPGERPPESCAVRGGGWNKFSDLCRLASRMAVLSVGRTIGIGFRLALSVPEPQ